MMTVTNLDILQVSESSDIKVRYVLWWGVAVVQQAVTAAHRESLCPVGSAQRRCAVQRAQVGW